MTTAVKPPPPHHDTLTCIKNYSCKRPECVARGLAYDRRRYRLVGYGTWEPLRDAEPVRQHIAALRAAGYSLPDIQRKARISSATLARLLYDGVNKRAKRIRPEVADRVLAVPVTTAPVKPSTIIDATGTRRRLQALVAMGWTLRALGPQLGFHPRRLTDLIHADQVLASTARRIADGYRTMQTRDPRDHGVPDRSINMARNLAAREGWHGPLAWDDIDDPACKPEKVKPYEAAAKYERDPDRMREIEHLYLLGESPEQIAKQLGGNEKYIRDQLNTVIAKRAKRAAEKTTAKAGLEAAA